MAQTALKMFTDSNILKKMLMKKNPAFHRIQDEGDGCNSNTVTSEKQKQTENIPKGLRAPYRPTHNCTSNFQCDGIITSYCLSYT